MRKWMVLPWLLAALFIAPALADGPTLEQQQVFLRQVQAAPKRGLLFEIKTASNTVYLFGTIHVGKKEFYPLNMPVTLALANSQRLYLEANMTDQAAVAREVNKLGLYPDGTTLDQKLPPALIERIQQKLDLYKFPRDRAFKMKPWLLANTLFLLDAARAGYDPAFAADLYLAGMAVGQRKNIEGLEMLSEQFAVFDALTEVDQLEFLKQIVEDIDIGRGMAQAETMVDAWASSDRAGLEKAYRTTKESAAPVEEALMSRMINDRNRVMAERISDIVRYGPRNFVAIGVLHLVGPDNVVDLLRKRGLTVTEL